MSSHGFELTVKIFRKKGYAVTKGTNNILTSPETNPNAINNTNSVVVLPSSTTPFKDAELVETYTTNNPISNKSLTSFGITDIEGISSVLDTEDFTYLIYTYSMTNNIFKPENASLELSIINDVERTEESSGVSVFNKATKAQNGDLAIAYISNPDAKIDNCVFFTGYVNNLATSNTSSGELIPMTISSFIERSYSMSFLGTLQEFAPKPTSEPVSNEEKLKNQEIQRNAVDEQLLKRNTTKTIELAQTGSYLSLVPFVTDLNDYQFYWLFSQGVSQSGVLSSIAEETNRLFFQRRDGTCYLTQMYSPNLPYQSMLEIEPDKEFASVDFIDQISNMDSSNFTIYDFDDMQKNAVNLARSINYSNIPYRYDIELANAPIINQVLQVATYTVKPNEKLGTFPNFDSPYKTIDAEVWNISQMQELTNFFTNYQVDIAKNRHIDIDVSLISKVSNEKNEDVTNIVTNYLKLQLLRKAYESLPDVEVITLTFPMREEFYYLDVGDVFINQDANYTVTNVEFSGQGADCEIAVSVIPSDNLTAVLSITNTQPIDLK